MHLVFVTSLVPDGAPVTGYEIATAAIVDGLRRAGIRVTMLGFTWPGRAPADPANTVALGALDVRNDAATVWRKALWLGEALRSGLTFSSAKMRAASEAAIRAALAGIEPYDGYVLNSVQLAGAFPHLFADRPSLYVAHNVEHRSAEESADAAQSPLQRGLFHREARLLRAIETRLCARARFVYTLAEDDRAALGVPGDDRSAALPLVTRASAAPRIGDRAIAWDAALIGTWTWAPNRIGLDWFLDEVAPLLAPDMRLAIAGALPAGLSSAHPGVALVGRVPDAGAFLRSAAVLPLVSRAGTGVQLKTIEAFELGLPAVATRHALRGVAHRPGNCVFADDAPAFAAALTDFIRRPRAAVDGAAFHRAQKAGLDAGLARGLATLRGRPVEVAA